MKVCLIIEGSYPYITGGVSAWVHELITALPDIEFIIYAISPRMHQKIRYTLPPNAHVYELALTDIEADADAAQGSNSTGLKYENEGNGTKAADSMLAGRDENTSLRAAGGFRARARCIRGILNAHVRMLAGSEPDPLELIASIPEGYSLRRDAILDTRAWQFINDQNRKRNPLYPFADYFWAWKSAHYLIFKVLAHPAPEADIYHSVSTGFAGLAALAAKLRHHKPFILTEHGLYHKEREIEIRKADFVRGYQRDLWINLYNEIARLCYKSADLCTSLFAENRDFQLALGASPERSVVIPNGIDVARFSVERHKKENEFAVGFVGRIVPIKDVKTFIVAAKLVLEKIRNARFYLVGPEDEDPDYDQECRRLAADLRIDDHIIFTGRADVRKYYEFLDVVVLTSIREGQPLVILEAYAAGIPCVSTNVGNVSELLEGDQRFIAPSKDAGKIAEGIEYVHDHPDEMAELVKKNRARVIAQYEKKELITRYRDLYRRFAPMQAGGAAAPEAPDSAPGKEAR